MTDLRWYSLTARTTDDVPTTFFTGYFSTANTLDTTPILNVYQGQDYENHATNTEILAAPASWASPDGNANKYKSDWASVHALFLTTGASFIDYTPPAGTDKNAFFGQAPDDTDATNGELGAYDSNGDPLAVEGTNLGIPITYDIQLIRTGSVPSCFNHGTKILCLNKNLEEEYIPVQDLRSGDFVKTYKHGYRKIDLIGKNPMINNPDVFTSCMYKMKKTEENGLTEDIIVTGGHCLLVDDLGEFKEKNDKIFGSTLMIDDKYMLLCGVSTDFVKLENRLPYTYYHFILENNGDNDERFGVWANGMLSETPSKNQFNAHKYTIM